MYDTVLDEEFECEKKILGQIREVLIEMDNTPWWRVIKHYKLSKRYNHLAKKLNECGD